jgi:hypothetical protein
MTAVHTKVFVVAASISMALFGCKPASQAPESAKPADATTSISVDDTRAIAREAYLWGFPMVESYKTLHAQAVDAAGPNFRVQNRSWKRPELQKTS